MDTNYGYKSCSVSIWWTKLRVEFLSVTKRASDSCELDSVVCTRWAWASGTLVFEGYWLQNTDQTTLGNSTYRYSVYKWALGYDSSWTSQIKLFCRLAFHSIFHSAVPFHSAFHLLQFTNINGLIITGDTAVPKQLVLMCYGLFDPCRSNRCRSQST